MQGNKEHLIEILEFYIFKLRRDGCTMEEIEAATRTLEENIPVSGTIGDFAEFYKKPESQIRATIARKLLAKPKRRLLYPFHEFHKIAPYKWHKDK